MPEENEVDLSSLAANWPSSYVARGLIREFTGGGLSPKRLANLDSLGEGPDGAVRCGRKVMYPVKNLVRWLEKRCQSKALSPARKKHLQKQEANAKSLRSNDNERR